MTTQELVEKYGKIHFTDYVDPECVSVPWKEVELVLSADEYEEKRSIESSDWTEIENSNGRAFENNYEECFLYLSDKGLTDAPVDGDLIDDKVVDDLLIISGHDGTDVYHLTKHATGDENA